MYESFFEMEHTPFTRDIPVERLYTSPQTEDAPGRLVYVVDHQMFAVVTANPGCGKSTMVRMLDGRPGKEKYLLLYLSDSKLTPGWLYAGLLGQLGLEPHYFSGGFQTAAAERDPDGQYGAEKESGMRAGRSAPVREGHAGRTEVPAELQV